MRMEHVTTNVRHDVEAKMRTPIVMPQASRFPFWKKPAFVNLQLIARELDLQEDWQQIFQRRQKLLKDLHDFQQQIFLLQKRESRWRKFLRVINWARTPARQTGHSQPLPGLGWEFALMAAHLVMGIAFLMI